MSRNRGKPTIKHLSYMKPTSEERSQLLKVAIDASPIATAILGAVFIEHDLEELIRSRLPKIDDSTWSSMLQENGPLSTFNQKILMGLALRIYDKETRENLKIVSNIRNAFAHSKRPIDFENDLIKSEIKKIQIPKFKKAIHREIKRLNYEAKECYIILCIIISTYLTSRVIESLKAKTRRIQRRSSGPLYSALIGGLSPRRISDLGLDLPQSPESKAGDPNPAVPQGLLSGLLPYLDDKRK